MGTFKIFADMQDGSQVSYADGDGDTIPTIGDELRAPDHTVVVYRRVFDVDSGEYHLYVRRVA